MGQIFSKFFGKFLMHASSHKFQGTHNAYNSKHSNIQQSPKLFKPIQVQSHTTIQKFKFQIHTNTIQSSLYKINPGKLELATMQSQSESSSAVTSTTGALSLFRLLRRSSSRSSSVPRVLGSSSEIRSVPVEG